MKKTLTEPTSNTGAVAETFLPATLAFFARDPDRFARFCEATGLDLTQLRAVVAEPGFVAGLLDFLCSDDAMLLAFAREHGVDPHAIERERQRLAASVDPPC